MGQQVADVAAVGTDRVLGEPTFGSQVALVGSEQRGVLLAELVVLRHLAGHRFKSRSLSRPITGSDGERRARQM
jgi:hypothetical protein